MSEYLQTLARAHADRRSRLWPVQSPRIAVGWPEPPKPKLPKPPKPYKFKRATIRRVWADPGKRNRQVDGITVKDIIAAVAKHYHVWPTSITAPIRTARLIAPRHMAMYLCRELLAKRSFPELAKHFKRHHTTVLSACQLVAMQLRSDPQIKAHYDKLRAKVIAWGERA